MRSLPEASIVAIGAALSRAGLSIRRAGNLIMQVNTKSKSVGVTMSAVQQNPAKPVSIHHIEGRRSFRVIWLCEELDIPYRLVYARGDLLASMVAIRRVHPLMPTVPVLDDGGELMMESGAVVEVLTARYGKGRLAPAVESADYPAHVQWMHFAEGTFMARLTSERFISMATGTPLSVMPKGYSAGVDPPDAMKMVGSDQIFRFVEDFLSKHAYFGGAQFSAADIMMHFSLRVAKLLVGIETSSYARIAAWQAIVENRPAYARAVAAALPDGMNDYMLPVGQPLPFPV
jgi:glutathione S-transferase